MNRRLYTLCLWLLLPWALFHLLWRSRRQPEYRSHWAERFGYYPRVTKAAAPVIWIHAVSVGETRAAQPLIKALRARFPDHRILLTHMTPTGRQTGIELFGDTVSRSYLAYDYPGAIGRFLDHWNPRFGLIMETELWPNLLTSCRNRSIPVMLVNGRLSDRSCRRYQRLPQLTREALSGLAGIAAQGPEDARRLIALGTLDTDKVAVLGNLKFDLDVPPDQETLGHHFRALLGDRPVFLCASTREGEEALILAAWQKAARGAACLVIVPRHPQRFDEVAEQVARHGLTLQRRSGNAAVRPDTDVWLGDSMGELFAYYAACDVAFIGGSLKDYGSQNLIEACAVGRPVLLGPSTFNFAEAAASALAAGAVRSIASAEDLVTTALDLLARETSRATMGEAGQRFAQTHRGATARTLAWIESRLGRPGL